ncbi:MAG: biotin/lipoate A/B protein ligase family protein, partial [Verrucomicrobiota bacterium]
LRRCSGGGTVVQGPGCLSYALLLRVARDPALQTIAGANGWILERQRRALARVTGGRVEVDGVTDLVLGGRKFSGNAQRRRREALLFHGTFLLRFDLAALSRWLRFPSWQPLYRAGRAHGDFVVNLGVEAEAVRAALALEWGARFEAMEPPPGRLAELLRERYANPEWNLRR